MVLFQTLLLDQSDFFENNYVTYDLSYYRIRIEMYNDVTC